MKAKKLEITIPKWLYDILVMQGKIKKKPASHLIQNAIMIYLAEEILEEKLE